MFRTTAKMKSAAEKLYQNAMLMINGDIESDFMLESLLTRAARLQPYAAGELGIHLFYAAATEAHYIKAIECLLQGIKGGHLLSRIYYANCLSEGLGGLRNVVKAAQELEIFVNEVKIHKQKNTWSTQVTQTRLQEHYCIALTDLAHKYIYGEGVKINQEKAISLLTTAESLGSKVAKLDYAILINQGIETAKNDKEKNQRLKIWLQKLTELAQDNYSEAQQDLAIYYCYGNPFLPDSPRDVEAAKLLFWNAALGGKHDCFYHLSQIYVQTNNLPLAFILLKLGALTGSKLAMVQYGKALYQDEDATPEEKVIGLNYIKMIADTGDVTAEYLYGSFMIKVYNPDAHDTGDEGLRAEALTFLRKAARSYQLAKLELAEALTAYPGKDIPSAFAEARKNLEEIIAHREQKSSVVYKSFIGLQQEAQTLLAKLHELEEKAQLKSQTLIGIDNEIEDKLEKPDPAAIKKKSHPNKPKKQTHFPPLHRRRQITYPKNQLEEELVKKIKPEEPALSELPVIENSPLPEVIEVKSDTPLAPEVCAPAYARLPRPLPAEVLKVLKLLKSQGYCAYVVGGLTRNILRGIDAVTDDIDMVTDAPLAVIEKLFNENRHLHVPNLVRFTKDNRSFDIVHVSNLKTDLRADALSRDFTINALYADTEGNVIDPLDCGLKDLNNPECQLQTILPAEECFKADPFRILRYLHFLSKQFTGALISAQIVKFMQDLQLTLADFKEKAVGSDTHLCEKVRLYEIFDSLICKFFMNGKSLKMFELLNAHAFFAIFFHADLAVYDQKWLRWRFQKMDEDGRFTKNRLYGMLLAAMLMGNTFRKEDINAMLNAGPYPCTLRWYNPLLEEVQIWLNEKTIFDCLPVNFRQALYEKTNSELLLTRHQRGISFANYSQPTPTQPPAFFTQKLYQQSGQFGHAINHFLAAEYTSLLPTPSRAS